MSYISYSYGYMYPNEMANGIVWLPIIATYILFVSIASGTAILLSIGVLFNVSVLRRLSPMFIMISLATAFVYLLGPLADLKRPDRAFYIFIYPHLTPSEMYPGVSLIALMASVMWPLLIILLIVLGYLILWRNMWNSLLTKILSLILIFVSLIWSTYFASLYFATIPVLRLNNLLPLLPVDLFLETMATAGAVGILAFIIHNRSLERSASKILSLTILICGSAFIILRFFQIFRLYTYLTGSPETSLFLNVFTPLNNVVFILALLSSVSAFYVYIKNSMISAFIMIITTILWSFYDKWLFAVDIQSISKTFLSIIPAELDLLSWSLESIAMILLSLFIYFILYTWVVKKPILDTGVVRGETYDKY